MTSIEEVSESRANTDKKDQEFGKNIPKIGVKDELMHKESLQDLLGELINQLEKEDNEDLRIKKKSQLSNT